MKKEKQLQALTWLASGYYKLIDGRLHSRIKGEWRIMGGNVLPAGYRQIFLFNRKKGEHGIRVLVYHHIAVYLMTNGEYPEGWQIDHKDRNCQNDYPDNLRAVDAAGNMANTDRLCHSIGGLRPVRAKEIADIRLLLTTGISQAEIARQLNLNRLSVRYTIKNIEAGKVLKYE